MGKNTLGCVLRPFHVLCQGLCHWKGQTDAFKGPPGRAVPDRMPDGMAQCTPDRLPEKTSEIDYPEEFCQNYLPSRIP